MAFYRLLLASDDGFRCREIGETSEDRNQKQSLLVEVFHSGDSGLTGGDVHFPVKNKVGGGGGRVEMFIFQQKQVMVVFLRRWQWVFEGGSGVVGGGSGYLFPSVCLLFGAGFRPD